MGTFKQDLNRLLKKAYKAENAGDDKKAQKYFKKAEKLREKERRWQREGPDSVWKC